MATVESLKTELETYNRNKERLVSQSEGKFVVIHDGDIAGVWDTYEDALQAAYEKFGLKPFLVKQVEAFEHVHSVTRIG
ncbi:MAG TPA: hypothetical protein VHY91_22095 [Pirellulales bacterium]|jgi:hypothetical protein|nr:hypothetical protein [Pirellulales bacterium]